jgi:hypothetical protein
MLSKSHPSTVHLDSEEFPLRAAVEPEPGGDEVFAGNEQVNLVVKVRDGTHIVDEHCDILLASNGGIVVDQVIVDELVELLEAGRVQGRGG